MSTNVIVVMTDDQGYGDLSCMGATDFRTPHLDRLARDGARFTCWYSNSSGRGFVVDDPVAMLCSICNG